MKVVIFAGGLGSRLQEETVVRPKPMVEIGGKPILWHIMKIYEHFGFNEFVIALGYKGEVIKDYFINYVPLSSDLTIDLRSGQLSVHESKRPSWKIHLIDTGLNTMTGGRLKRLAHILGDGPFMATYGDGLANVDLRELLTFHKKHGKIATVTATIPPSRFGGLEISDKDDLVSEFAEKPHHMASGKVNWINGGFFVLERRVLDYLEDDSTIFERGPLEKLCANKELVAFKHPGFFQPMDVLREKMKLEDLWAKGEAPWKVWND